MKLIDEWRQAWRWFSMQAMVAVAAIQGGWAAIPDDLRQHFPHLLVTALSVGLLVLGIGGRLVSQKKRGGRLMPTFLTSVGAALAANALKLGLGLLLLVFAAGGGFVWGDTHATRIAAEAAAKDADARVAAVQKSYQAVLSDYQGNLTAQTTRGDALAAQLAADQTRLAAVTAQAKEQITHAVPQNSVCDLPAAALRLLNAQPARS